MKYQAASAQPARSATAIEPVAIRDLFKSTQQIFDQIARRAYEIFESRGYGPGNDLEDWLRAESELLEPVKVELHDAEDLITVSAPVAGFTAKELEVSIEPRRVTICGRHETSEKRKGHEKAESLRQIFCRVDLPAEVDPARAKAGLRSGTLGIAIPKVAPARKIAAEAKRA